MMLPDNMNIGTFKHQCQLQWELY